MHSIMANINLGQDAAALIVAKSYPLGQAVGIHRYGSLININPSEIYERAKK